MPKYANSFADLTGPLTTDQRVSKAIVNLRGSKPFFAYLIDHLYIIYSDEVSTAGITKSAKCYINEKFVEPLTASQLDGLLSHEILHPALFHFDRGAGRDATVNGMRIINICQDLQINQMLDENGIELPPGGVVPKNNEYQLGPILLKDISSKSSEELYDEVVAQLKREQEENPSSGSGSGDYQIPGDIPGGFDEHLHEEDDENDDGSGVGGKGETESQDGSESSKPSASPISNIDWPRILAEAHTYAKLVGKEPAGFNKIFDQLHKPKVNWRAVLRQTVASSIPEDMTWSKPNKKYLAHDLYLPSPYGESIKVICAIDTSGSISHDDLTDFISEIAGIARSYHEAEFIILTHDVDVHDEIPVCDATRQQLESLELHGGGGTSHIPVFEHITENKCKWNMESTVVICFTDGYSDFPDQRPPVDQIVFVLAGGHCPKEDIPYWANAVLSIE